tara:strand:- start:179 stop:490 length:312 start_codon:yes stop_codon:yes gene_type:complete
VVDLHAKIKDGSVILTDGKFPKEAAELFRKHGVEQPHIFKPDDDGEYVDKVLQEVRHYSWSTDKVRPSRLSKEPVARLTAAFPLDVGELLRQEGPRRAMLPLH